VTQDEMTQLAKTVGELLAQRTGTTAPAAAPQATTPWPPAPAATPWAPAQPAGAPWGAMVPAGQLAVPEPQALLLRVSLPMPDGSGEVAGYLAFPPEAVQALPAIVARYGVTVYPQRQSYGGGGNFGFGRRYGSSGRRW